MVAKRNVVAIGIVLIALAAIVIAIAVVYGRKSKGGEVKVVDAFLAQTFSKAAVATDARPCSELGRDVLQKGGSAVDAAVSALLCIGLYNMHSTGIGGGGFMNIYIRSERKSRIYDFRETAPAKAYATMFLRPNASSVTGGLAVAVPGNVLGMRLVWEKYGKLPWKDLFTPVIKMAREGFPLPLPVADSLASNLNRIKGDPGMQEVLMKNGVWLKAGEMVKNEKLAQTLETISINPFDFYNGTLASTIVADINAAGGNMTLGDLKNYTVTERQTLNTTINGLDFHLMPPPGSGVVVGMIMNILKGYNLTSADLSTLEKRIQTAHKMVEAFKFSYARRALLGDPSFLPKENISRVISAMLNQTFAEEIRRNKIWLNQTHSNVTYYGGYYSQNQDPYGTSHLSVLAENGDAVAVTDTINYGFGCGVRSTKNGIIYNNEMDDFSTPGLVNLYGYPPTEANFIAPGKRPLSSMSPTIVTDKNGDVIMVVGASGGSRIITGTATTLIRKLYLDVELGHAVSDARIHHQLVPNMVQFYSVKPEFTPDKALLDGLAKLKHEIQGTTGYTYSVVQAIYRDNKGILHAKSDPRKGDGAAGY